jgi:mannose-6-phosphate isomerase-like protein (cupin superfamily)
MSEKPWGRTERVHFDGRVQLERITIQPGGYSSIHLHEFKTNGFLVVEGVLIVRRFRPDGQLEDLKTIHAGEWVAVPPNVRHQFYAEQKVVGYELYWSTGGGACEPDDIRRFSEHGLNGKHEAGEFLSWRIDEHRDPNNDQLCAICNGRVETVRGYVLAEWEGAIREICRPCSDEVRPQIVAESPQPGAEG